jgi:hypothetical protein
MTQDEIIEMAEEAGLYYNKSAFVWTSPTAINLYPEGVHPTALEDFAKLVAQHEREACAKVCEEQMQGKSIWIEGARACSLAIRARGQA